MPRSAVRPLAQLNKELPRTPSTEMVASLDDENEMLRLENQNLRGQIDMWINQVRRYRKITNAARELMKKIGLHVEDLHQAVATMERTEEAAENEWIIYQGAIENHFEEMGVMENRI